MINPSIAKYKAMREQLANVQLFRTRVDPHWLDNDQKFWFAFAFFQATGSL